MTMVGPKEMQMLLSAIGSSQKAMSAQSAKAFITLVQTVKPTVFWEVGKAIGAYAWLALEHSKTCQAILFEADPENYAALRKTINSKQLHRAEAKNIVVSSISDGMWVGEKPTAETDGTPSKCIPCEREALPPIAIKRGFYGMKQSAVETVTLDDLLAQGYASPDIIKIDTQAAETLIMDGARQMLETCSPLLIVKTDNHALVRYLEGLSYRSFPFDQDNLIFISVYF